MPPLCPWHRACQGCVWVSFGARWGRNTAMSQLVPRVVPPEVPLPLRWCRKQCWWAMDPQDHMWAKPIWHNLETWKYLWSWPERCNIQKHIGHGGGKRPWCSLSGKFIPFPNSSCCCGCCWSRAHTNTETFFKVSSSHQSLRLMFFLTQLLLQACWPFSSYTKTEEGGHGNMRSDGCPRSRDARTWWKVTWAHSGQWGAPANGEKSKERPVGSPEERTPNEVRNPYSGGRYSVSFLAKWETRTI